MEYAEVYVGYEMYMSVIIPYVHTHDGKVRIHMTVKGGGWVSDGDNNDDT